MNSDREKLASEFIDQMREAVGFRACSAIDFINQQRNDSTCASHDFCDANEVMWNAFEKTFNREIDSSSNDDTDLVNEAWDEAKLLGFGRPKHMRDPIKIIPMDRGEFKQAFGDPEEQFPYAEEFGGIKELYYCKNSDHADFEELFAMQGNDGTFYALINRSECETKNLNELVSFLSLPAHF